MKELLAKGYKAKLRPSGHDISDKFSKDNGAAIPPNLLAIANTESNSAYIRYCHQIGVKAHPARFPAELPEYFIRMLTDKGDLVVDPFGGSCITGEVAGRLLRQWVCCELVEDYLRGGVGRFLQPSVQKEPAKAEVNEESGYYKIGRPGLNWNGKAETPLPTDGGKKRPKKYKMPDQLVMEMHEPKGRYAKGKKTVAKIKPKKLHAV